jgi:beta-phosphoglucomutase-like phosphatase (HAD superfamily)
MAPVGALIFKLEQTFFRAELDYVDVQELIKKEQPGEASLQFSQGLASTLLALKRRMGKKAYEELRKKAEIVADRLETQALGSAQMHPGVTKMLEAVRDSGWWVVAASDVGKKPIADFLESRSLSQYMNLVVARSRLDEDRLLAKRLRPVQSKLKSLASSVYFCNSSREVAEAKALGMKCFVLPSPVEPFRTLYQAGPNGIILSLDEIPPLLSLPAMKLLAPPRPVAKKGASRRTKKSRVRS